MLPKIDIARLAPQIIMSLRGLDASMRESSLDPKLLQLVRVRASQLNGSAFELDQHSREARALGESEQRLYTLSAWTDTPFFTEKEQAALAWCEAITLIAEGPIAEDDYDLVRASFSDRELVELTLAICLTGVWNRLSMSFGALPEKTDDAARP